MLMLALTGCTKLKMKVTLSLLMTGLGNSRQCKLIARLSFKVQIRPTAIASMLKKLLIG